MIINVDGVKHELKFTFNSFRYMDEFDITEFEQVENKPFKLIKICENLTYGAINHNRNNVFSKDEVCDILEKLMADNLDMGEFIEKLMTELDKSDFFKSLQKKPEKKLEKKK